jgi:hypothetical protein
MKGFEEIDAIEALYQRPSGLPMLGKSQVLLLRRWQTQEHDRETALRNVGGDPDHWEDVGLRMYARLGIRRYRMDPARFEGRGYFGAYLAHQARGWAKAPLPPDALKHLH